MGRGWEQRRDGDKNCQMGPGVTNPTKIMKALCRSFVTGPGLLFYYYKRRAPLGHKPLNSVDLPPTSHPESGHKRVTNWSQTVTNRSQSHKPLNSVDLPPTSHPGSGRTRVTSWSQTVTSRSANRAPATWRLCWVASSYEKHGVFVMIAD